MDTLIVKIKQYKWIVLVVVIVSLGYVGQQLNASKAKVAAVRTETSQVASKTSSQKPSSNVKGNSVITVDVQGAVKKPGVYRLSEKSIVQAAINEAGGFLENADVKKVNQAMKLRDGQQIIVPIVGETVTSGAKPSDSSSSASTEKVNLNTAEVGDFNKVSGVGPKKAEKIIAYREKNGNFKSIDELSKVGGFGQKTIDKLRDSLTV